MRVISQAGAILVMVIAFWISGCAMDSMFTCNTDADCTDEEYCIADQCTPECSHDEECPSGSSCEVYQRQGEANPVQACLDPNAAGSGGIDCESDHECRAALEDDSARCGMHHRCVLSDEHENSDPANGNATNGNNENNDANDNFSENNDVAQNRYILVVEQLNADGEPVLAAEDDGGDDNGGEDDKMVRPVHLGAVIVRDQDIRAVGYGRTIAVTSDVSDDPPMDLAELPLPGGTCLEDPEYAPYTSLGGPGGRGYIELIDESQNSIEVLEEWVIQIVSDGPECPIGPRDDEREALAFGQYRALLCVIEESDPLPADTDCAIELEGPFSGFTELKVTFPE